MFLNGRKFRSEIDWKGVAHFCQNEYDILLECPKKFYDEGIGFIEFGEWLKNGYGGGDIVRYNNNLSILGKCNISDVVIEAFFANGSLTIQQIVANVSEIERVAEEERKEFYRLLAHEGLQFHEAYQKIVEKYIPKPGEKVVFQGESDRGVGVVREYDEETKEVIMYCYYMYGSGKIGYSMHENIGMIHDYIFSSMNISARRRLDRELQKYGKTWHDKMKRVEPVNAKAKEGEAYWYITDQFKLKKDIEKGTPKSHFRYLAGNYFLEQNVARDIEGKINELVRDQLAK